ncbi:hypothetical protein GGI25_006500 [Coemansia spiralis]|uniref:Glutathione S-transferase n=1 Tax=Coemansia spiralis TaxID=417178 RepID=A0A9W8G0U7_9FUNG|nr:hypothetical protein BX070DRAFT_222901 [Coemansia spiralis]KAJ2618475.1 hypothetical protein GGI26_006544 [Coemansia sp. RSA 1358]KAJ2668027.1 hypothetical protein GGI25_006500 [Coemansia spiralis]
MSASATPSYVFRYFNTPGFGETTRLLLTIANVDWVEENPEWPQEKPNQPFGRLPVLVEKSNDGSSDFVLSESGTIERYIARKYNIIPSNPKEASRQEQLRDQMVDIIIAVSGASKGDEGAKAKFNELSAKMKEVMAKSLKDNGNNGHFTGDKLTYIDIFVYSNFKSILNFSKQLAPEFADTFNGMITPEVEKLISTVNAEPRLQARLAEDKQYFPFLA